MKSCDLFAVVPAPLKWMFAGIAVLGGVLEADVAAPQLAPSTADSPVALDFTVTCATPGAGIRYTLNGSEPTLYHPQVASGGSIRVARNAVVKVKAWVGSESSQRGLESGLWNGTNYCGCCTKEGKRFNEFRARHTRGDH
jgi:Chitobiase/beta-hexosaminidase C-terminal domain